MQLFKRQQVNGEQFTTKHQPKHIDNFVGNVNVLKKLKAILDSKNRHHGYIISGPYGVGKTCLAHALARYIGADDYSDVVIVNISTCKDLKQMRKVFSTFNYKPHGKARVFFFDEAQTITPSAQEEILPYLDNPHTLTYFVFATAQPDKLIVPLQDRCFHVALQPLTFKEGMRLSRRIRNREEIELDRQVLRKIAKRSEGIPRKLVNLLFEEISMLRSRGKRKVRER
jgi:DNA polymerase III delta prime subunit